MKVAIIRPIHRDLAHPVPDDELRSLLSAINAPQGSISMPGSVAELRNQSDRVLRWRRIQRSLFPEAVFRESCWDILLLCLSGQLAGRQMCVKQIRNELDESSTSLLRRLQELEDAGMLRRERDDVDGRRTIVRLTDEAATAMSRYFKMIGDDIGS
jgi:DNA-binding MarR family transcriptional regulator